MKRNEYQIGDLLIKADSQEVHIITSIRESAYPMYGSRTEKRKEYEVFGRHYRHRPRTKRWLLDTDLRVKYYRP
jgi:hypothetical protein